MTAISDTMRPAWRLTYSKLNPLNERKTEKEAKPNKLEQNKR